MDGIDAHQGEAAVLVEAFQPVHVGAEPDGIEVLILPAEAFADRGVQELVEPARGLARRHLRAEFAGGEGLIAFDGDRGDLELAAGRWSALAAVRQAAGTGAQEQGGEACTPPRTCEGP